MTRLFGSSIYLSSPHVRLSDSDRRSLRGITKANVLVEDLGPNEHRSGLTKDALTVAAMRPLADAGITVTEKSGVMIYVHVTAIELDGSSAVHITIQASDFTMVRLPHQEEGVVGEVVLWRAGHLMTGRNIPKRVEDVVKRYTAEFATLVKLANQ